MSSKKWLIMFVFCILLLPVILMGINFTVDPFGVFGNLKWYSFSETLNPRVSKTEYLIENADKYDSYLVGCSSTSSYPVEDLNKYLNANFYNTISYGADMFDAEQTVKWLIDNCTVKNIVLNVYIHNGVNYNDGEDSILSMMHYKMSDRSAFDFYLKYLLADPNYALDKLEALKNDKWATQTFDVFNEETGAYDKKIRDIEHISDMESYFTQYPVFTNYPVYEEKMKNIDNCMKSVKNIVEMCENANIKLYVVCSPIYSQYIDCFSNEDLTEFYTALANTTDFWDFSYSSVSYEPRYFYDETHFRNDVGSMAIARMFNDDSVYIPDDFGRYITKDNVSSLIDDIVNRKVSFDVSDYTKEVPILLYHSITAGEPDNSGMTVSVQAFENQIRTLYENGYTAITFNQLYDYVEKGIDLPEKPVLITFDDGYLNNYELAFPILEKYNMNATIFIIGVSVGKDTYKDTGKPMTEHFTMEQAKEMLNSGLIDIQSHTYDMHQVENLDKAPVRQGVLKFDDESEADYIKFFCEDMTKSIEQIENSIGNKVTILSYPYGNHSDLSEAICNDILGIKSTVTTNQDYNTIIKGLNQSLYGLNRIYVVEDSNIIELLQSYM